MAGTLFGLGLSQQHDINGTPMAGALLYVYDAGTLNPADVFQDAGLTAGQEHSHPMVADATGRIPQFWMVEGQYRARLTSAEGVVQFDEDFLIAIGPGEAPTPVTVPSDQLLQTGDIKWRAGEEDLDEWFKLNGQTVGKGSSGATHAADANQALFEYLWNNFPNTICAVSTGRGASASADFTTGIGKTIALLDMRGRGPFGLDDMGAASAGRLSGLTFGVGDATTGGSSGGAGTHTLTTAQLPSITPTFTGTQQTWNANETDIADFNTPNGGGLQIGSGVATLTARSVSTTVTPAGTISSFGSGAAHPTISPFLLGTWYIKR